MAPGGVNVDIPPGRYLLAGSKDCYWERLRGFSGALADIVANEFVPSGRVVVDIAPTHAGFSSSRCGPWQTFNPPPTPSPATTFDTGTYVVGQDIYPGLYRSPGGTGCSWERLRGFGGSISPIFANDFAALNPLLRIEVSDVGSAPPTAGRGPG